MKNKKCPNCDELMKITLKEISLNDIKNMIEHKMKFGKILKPSDKNITGYVCFNCGYSEKI